MYFAASASMLSSFWIEYKRGFQFWRSPAGLNSVSRMYCVVDVHAGENGKHVGLQEGYEEFECGNRDRHDQRQDSAADTDRPKGRQRNDEARKDLERDVASKHVRKRRTERLIGRDRNEMISMATTSGTIMPGTPLGTNSLRKPKPCLKKP